MIGEFKPPPPRADLLWAGIDLDGTLAQSLWSPEMPNAPIGPPIEDNLAKARKLHDRGYKLWIHTARPSSDYEQIEAWCHYYDIPIKGIVCGKPLFAVYIDDRNVQIAAPDWSDQVSDYQELMKVCEDEAYARGWQDREDHDKEKRAR